MIKIDFDAERDQLLQTVLDHIGWHHAGCMAVELVYNTIEIRHLDIPTPRFVLRQRSKNHWSCTRMEISQCGNGFESVRYALGATASAAFLGCAQ